MQEVADPVLLRRFVQLEDSLEGPFRRILRMTENSQRDCVELLHEGTLFFH